jgi:hypothetical protein
MPPTWCAPHSRCLHMGISSSHSHSQSCDESPNTPEISVKIQVLNLISWQCLLINVTIAIANGGRLADFIFEELRFVIKR